MGPEQKQFRSSVQLFGRVTPDATGPPTYNEQFYPGIQSNTVITIAEEDDLFGSIPISDMYDTTSNPLAGRISQIASKPIGSAGASGAYNFLLSVFETTPVESRLDIYYETSTSGLISELNAAIEQGGTTNANGATAHQTTFNENQSHTNSSGAAIDVEVTTTAWAPVIFGEAANQDLPANRLTASIASVTSLSDEKNKLKYAA